MTVAEPVGGYLGNIPGTLVVKAQQDIGFALRLLDRETREAAIQEADLSLTDYEQSELFSLLDEIAGLSFEEILRKLKAVGSLNF